MCLPQDFPTHTAMVFEDVLLQIQNMRQEMSRVHEYGAHFCKVVFYHSERKQGGIANLLVGWIVED